jgi:hypothetical protein
VLYHWAIPPAQEFLEINMNKIIFLIRSSKIKGTVREAHFSCYYLAWSYWKHKYTRGLHMIVLFKFPFVKRLKVGGGQTKKECNILSAASLGRQLCY